VTVGRVRVENVPPDDATGGKVTGNYMHEVDMPLLGTVVPVAVSPLERLPEVPKDGFTSRSPAMFPD